MSIKRIGSVAFLLLCTFLEAQSFSIQNFHLNIESFFVPEKTIPAVRTETGFAGLFIPTNHVRLNFDVSATVEDIPNFFHPLVEHRSPGHLYFDGASVQFPNIHNTSAMISVFTGFFEDPSSSSLLREYFKVAYDKPAFRDLPSGSFFNPNVDIAGTGIALTGVPFNKNIALGAYGYWNSLKDDKATVTADFRISSPGSVFSINAFGGFFTNIATKKPYVRGGLSSLLGNNSTAQLYVEAVIINYEIGDSRIDRNIHLLFEPRIKRENHDLAFTFFYSPVEETDSNFLGTNLLWGLGNIEKHKMRGGLSLLGSFNPQDPGTITPFSFSVTPFYSIMKGDLIFQIAATINPLLLSNYRTAGKIQATIKAVY